MIPVWGAGGQTQHCAAEQRLQGTTRLVAVGLWSSECAGGREGGKERERRKREGGREGRREERLKGEKCDSLSKKI